MIDPRTATLAVAIGRHSALPPDEIVSTVAHLQRLAKQLAAVERRRQTGYADERGDWQTAEQEADDQREDRLRDMAQVDCARLGDVFSFVIQGGALYLSFGENAERL